MKSKLVKFLILLLAICTVCFVGCNQGENIDTPPKESAKIELSKYSLDLEKLEDYILTATVDGTMSTALVWKSSNERVATVNGGTVSAIGAGNAVIIASVGESQARCTVSVSDHGLCPGITTNISQEKLVLLAGDEFVLESEVTYNDKSLEGVEVTYANACEDGSVTVENGKIIANEKGNAVITLSATWKGFNCKYIFEVNVVSSACVRLHEQNYIELCNEQIGGQTTVTLDPYFVIEDTALSSTQYEITSWTYDDKVVTFNEDTLTVQALCKGQTEIVAVFEDLQSGLSFECVLPISVTLVDYDKTETCVLDTLYLDQVDYLLSKGRIYFDKTAGDLEGCVIESVTDVTYKTTYNVPITSDSQTGDASINVPELNKLGLDGNRKWRVECGKFSYIVSVPVMKTNVATPLLGKYVANDWDYDVELVFENNKNSIKITEKATNTVVETGLFEIKPWKESLNDGTHGVILITLNGKDLIEKDELQGFYYYANGGWQIHLTIAGYYKASNYKILYGSIKDFTESSYLGNYSSNEVSVELKENGVCIIKDENGEQTGTYSITPNKNDQSNGTIVINGNDGNEVYSGKYSFNTGSCSIALDGVIDHLIKDNGDDIDRSQYAGYYGTVTEAGAWSGWCMLYLGADGKVMFAYTLYDRVEPGVGYYNVVDGVITINITTGYYKGEYTGDCVLSEGGVVSFSIPIYKGQTYRKIV